jgi:hypothetical protein
MPVISALKRLRQEGLQFKASLVYISGPCLKNPKVTKYLKAWAREREGGGRL